MISIAQLIQAHPGCRLFILTSKHVPGEVALYFPKNAEGLWGYEWLSESSVGTADRESALNDKAVSWTLVDFEPVRFSPGECQCGAEIVGVYGSCPSWCDR